MTDPTEPEPMRIVGPVEALRAAVAARQSGEYAARAGEQLQYFADGIRAVGTAAINIAPAFGDIYDAIAALGSWTRPPRSSKAARARAKAAKLRQRRAAQAAPRPWGTDWRETAPMLRKSIGSIVRDGVPCHAIPCIPVTTVRLSMGPIAFVGADQ